MGSSDWQRGPDTGVFGMRYFGDGGRGLPDLLFVKNLQENHIKQGAVGGETGLILSFVWKLGL